MKNKTFKEIEDYINSERFKLKRARLIHPLSIVLTIACYLAVNYYFINLVKG